MTQNSTISERSATRGVTDCAIPYPHLLSIGTAMDPLPTADWSISVVLCGCQCRSCRCCSRDGLPSARSRRTHPLPLPLRRPTASSSLSLLSEHTGAPHSSKLSRAAHCPCKHPQWQLSCTGGGACPWSRQLVLLRSAELVLGGVGCAGRGATGTGVHGGAGGALAHRVMLLRPVALVALGFGCGWRSRRRHWSGWQRSAARLDGRMCGRI